MSVSLELFFFYFCFCREKEDIRFKMLVPFIPIIPSSQTAQTHRQKHVFIAGLNNLGLFMRYMRIIKL